MTVKTKDAKSSQTKVKAPTVNGKAQNDVKAKLQRIGSTTAAERLEKLEALNGLKQKFEKVKEADAKLNSFEAANHKGNFVLSLSGEGAEPFKTNNYLITSKVVGLIREGIEELKAATNEEILNFDI